jgi:cytochrome c oxidase cbb3-type subunit 2
MKTSLSRIGRVGAGLGLSLLYALAFPPASTAQPAAMEERVARLERQASGAALSRQADLVTGREIYKAACMTCHGINGDGRGPAAKWLHPKPRDFTKGLFKWRSTPFGALPTDADLERVIRDGVSGTTMFPFGEILTKASRMAVVQYIKTFAPAFADPARQPAAETILAVPDQRPFPRSEESIARGKAQYETKGCAACHGPRGGGDGPAGAALVDAWNEPVRPWNFRHAYYKSGVSDQDLYRTIATGLNGTPMTGYLTLTTEEERWQLVDFIRSLGGAHDSLLHYLFVDEPSGSVYDREHTSAGFWSAQRGANP